MSSSSLSRLIERCRTSRALLVQGRMGSGRPQHMRQMLSAVKEKSKWCVGTITLDSYTRVGDYATPLKSVALGKALNGYPIVSHSIATTRRLLEGICDEGFPVQVRHGTPDPRAIFRRLVEVGLDATEGGPVSYSLPYGRTNLRESSAAWREACEIFSEGVEHAHLESFGGCLLGQLCPPSMLIATSLLECLFFRTFGIRSVSLSYAQGTSYAQDRAAIAVLRDLATIYLRGTDWHVVLYTYMGRFPTTRAGATRLIADSARLARETGCERLIVKTTSERRQIPTLQDNLHALHIALSAARLRTPPEPLSPVERRTYEELYADALGLVDSVLNLDADISAAIPRAFELGLLDVPYCLHPDNRGQARASIDEQGFLRWTHRGALRVRDVRPDLDGMLSSSGLLAQLSYVADRYDGHAAAASRMSARRRQDLSESTI